MGARHFCILDRRVGAARETLRVGLSRPLAAHPNRIWDIQYEVEGMKKVVVVKKTKRASRMSGEGLTSGRVKKYKMILRMLNIELVEAGRTCSSLSEK